LTYQQQVADLNCAIGCDASNQVSPSAPVDVPAGKPTAPTNVVATAGNGTISVTFGAPSSDGGAPITSYTATDSATGDTASGASPLGFTARANDVPRTISVVANNSAGAGTVAVSNSVTPAAGPPATPSITTPTTIGVASSYTPMDSVTSQQWKLDGVNATGGTGATFAQVLADAGKALTLTASNAAGSVTSLPTIPGVRNMKLSNTPNVRAGLAGARCAWVNVGDSDQSGYGSGGTAGSDAGGRQNSYPHKMAAALAAIGLPFGKDSSFGSGLATTPAAYMAYDPRWTFSAGVTLLAGFPSFGGSMFGLPSGETAVWTPGNTFNRVDIMPANSGAATSVEVVVGGTVIQVIPLAAGVSGLKVITVTVPNGTTAVTLRYSVGSGAAVPYIDGITTWTSTAPKIEVLNGALSGTTVQANAVTPVTTVNSTSGYVPRAAMAAIAAAYPNAILCLNGYFNDNPARTITQILADIKLICDHAKLLGWDIAYMGYTTLGAVLSKTQQDSFDDQIIAFLIANYDCWIFQQSKVFPVYSSASAGGYMSDQLHKTATGAQKVADALVGAVKIINSGLLPA
jgi:hypothetical protein